ncbi:MAG: hypothetical protein IKP28_02275 [Clostridia bacterium]|nr:hypothetical protein [Clostridia bacterium]
MKNKKAIKLAIAILGILIIIIIVALSILSKDFYNKTNNKTTEIPSEYNEAEALLKYYQCSEINITDSPEENFEKDIYLIFGKDLWTDEKSNEGYFNNIIINLTPILEYKNYRMIDNQRQLVISIISENEQIQAIYINGQVNYFQKEETKKTVKKGFKETETTSLTVEAKELKDLLNNNWKASQVSFGTVESRYSDYDIYFDEGIEVKTLGGKVYNIIFNEKYLSTVVNGLKVNENQDKIIETLGKPTFESKSNGIIGYKGQNIYVFFSENEISIYRVEDDYNEEKFLKLWSEFQETKNAREFVSKITGVWDDFDEYITDSQFVYLKYSLKGAVIQFNTNGENGLTIYNNFGGTLDEETKLSLKDINESNIPQNVYLHTTEDLVFVAEQNRVSENIYTLSDEFMKMQDEELYFRILEDEESDVNYNFSEAETGSFRIAYTYTTEDGIYGVKIISKDRKNPNSELIRHKQIYTYGWISEEEFVYSVKGQGIYCYNARTRELKTILEGDEIYKIKTFANNTIYYDNTKIKL